MHAEDFGGGDRQIAGFRLDSANSPRNFESAEAVLDLPGRRAFCYHLKDHLVKGPLPGFSFEGVRPGEGNPDLDGALERIFTMHDDPKIYLENRPPATGKREDGIAAGRQWLAAGPRGFERRAARRRAAESRPVAEPAR